MKAAESKKLRELTCAAVHLSLVFFKEQISKVIFFCSVNIAKKTQKSYRMKEKGVQEIFD